MSLCKNITKKACNAHQYILFKKNFVIHGSHTSSNNNKEIKLMTILCQKKVRNRVARLDLTNVSCRVVSVTCQDIKWVESV